MIPTTAAGADPAEARGRAGGQASGTRRGKNVGRGRRPSHGALVALALVAALAVGATAQPVPTVWTELVRLTTADNRENAAVLHAPIGRAPRGGVVLVHGYASNFYSAPGAALARDLAGRGFMTLSTNVRDHDGGPKTTLFEENRWDEQAAVDELARRGASPLALVGSSLGTNRVLFYAAETREPRIRALVLLGAVGNAFEWNVRQFGRDRATRVLDEALRLQRDGRGKELMVVDLGPLGQALYSADHLVSLRGPQTRSDPYRNIAQLAVPVLLVYAGDDRLVDLETSRKLRATAARSPRADLVEIPSADHAFSRHGPELAAAVDRWLAEVLGR